ncbi:MAG TPA: VWA domain-containing protein, partial [Pararobbsia sp.]|nr:VWA domain-containing protein [Pararobbsia sp.]
RGAARRRHPRRRPGGAGVREGETRSGLLAENVVHFARVLRVAGLPVGPGQMLDALAAARMVGVERRDDWQAAMAAILVKRREHHDVFDQAFAAFWRDPDLLAKVLAAMLPRVPGRFDPKRVSPRVAHAMAAQRRSSASRQEASQEPEVVAFGASKLEQLQHVDFEKMTPDEWHAVAHLLETLSTHVEPLETRRYAASSHGSVDARATLRAALRTGGETVTLRFRRHRKVPPPLVVLCDISGSMQRYSRMMLHWLHGLIQREPVSVFLFGTRLTPVTRMLRTRDVDVALAAVSKGVSDWSGGTRIAAALEHFNRDWSRRLLARNAVVLIVTDGLEADDDDGHALAGAHPVGRRSSIERLGAAAERLSKSCRELIWLNPLLRYDGFEPRAAGVQALLPHVDRHIPVHNLAAYAQLARALQETTRWK